VTERWESVLAKVAELGRANVRAGVVGPKASQVHPDTGLTNAELGLIHELGTRDGRIPERSFVRSTLRDPAIRAEFAALQGRIAAAVMLGRMDRDRGLGLLGAWIAGKIRERIVSHQIRPEDAPATIAAKGNDVPLIGTTGQLVAAVSWEIAK